MKTRFSTRTKPSARRMTLAAMIGACSVHLCVSLLLTVASATAAANDEVIAIPGNTISSATDNEDASAPAISDDKDERWYRVELLVFSQRGQEQPEQWDPTPTLRYPESARFLMERAPVGSSARLAPNGEGPALVKLQGDDGSFGEMAQQMARSSRYQVLFHEQWVQVIGDKAEATPLILDRSGDTEQWPALQGSITLWLSRYLHLQTNLWLNTQGEYLHADWRMPPAPLGPASTLSEDGSERRASATEALASMSPEAQRTTLTSEVSHAKDELVNEGDPRLTAYPFRHAVLLQQKRRMRSRETHYIDHPLLGLVIRLTPIEKDELAATF